MPIIRKQLLPSDVYPDNLRYNSDTGQVQTLVNGDWVDNPAADPRTQTTFPPLSTADPRCDSAQNVADAFKNQIDGILNAIDGAGTAFTIAGLILGLFEFGPFGIFIAIALFIANAMLDAGTTALSAALTTTVYHQLACILYCHMDSSGRVNSGELSGIEDDISSQIGGLAATILNAMLSLAGEGGVNNLGSIGTSTGDCSDCSCCGCDLTNWIEVVGNTITYTGTCIATIVATNGHGDAQYYAGFYAPTDSADCHQFGVAFDVTMPPTATRAWAVCGEGIVAGNLSFFLNPGSICYRTMYFASPDPFTVTITCEADCS